VAQAEPREREGRVAAVLRPRVLGVLGEAGVGERRALLVHRRRGIERRVDAAGAHEVRVLIERPAQERERPRRARLARVHDVGLLAQRAHPLERRAPEEREARAVVGVLAAARRVLRHARAVEVTALAAVLHEQVFDVRARQPQADERGGLDAIADRDVELGDGRLALRLARDGEVAIRGQEQLHDVAAMRQGFGEPGHDVGSPPVARQRRALGRHDGDAKGLVQWGPPCLTRGFRALPSRMRQRLRAASD
jgi:hypothetical protein